MAQGHDGNFGLVGIGGPAEDGHAYSGEELGLLYMIERPWTSKTPTQCVKFDFTNIDIRMDIDDVEHLHVRSLQDIGLKL